MRYFIYQFPPSPPSATAKDRVFNFAAGPANLPESVILKAQAELFNYRGSGISIMEMSHRSKEFDAVIKKAESDLRLLLSIPGDYAVLFLQGGATTQFAALSLNLCTPDSPTDYIITGSWGDKAYREAQKYCKPTVVWSGKPEKYTKIPSFDSIEQNPDLAHKVHAVFHLAHKVHAVFHFVVSWNSIISAHAESNNEADAWEVFVKMLTDGCQPSEVTLTGMATVSRRIAEGRVVHGLLT